MTASEPGSFSTQPKGGKNQTLWRYELEPAAVGSKLRESFQVLWCSKPLGLLAFGGRHSRLAQLQENVRGSVRHIKIVVETPLPKTTAACDVSSKPLSYPSVCSQTRPPWVS